MFESMPGVERSLHILKPYKLVAREWHKANTVIDVRRRPDRRQDGAGDRRARARSRRGRRCTRRPRASRAGGARLMRGGAFKPRTTPYAFQGKGVEGLKLLKDAAARRKLPVVTELMDVRMLDTFLEHGVDVIQIGTRNMQNFDLLKEVGQVDDAGDPEARHERDDQRVADGGRIHRRRRQPQHHLCERGIRTFETAYRNVLDVTAIAVLKRETHLPVIVDPSHAGGKAWMVPALSCAAVAAGADGLLVEIHPTPKEAWCDADQALTPDEFAVADATARRDRPRMGRELSNAARVHADRAWRHRIRLGRLGAARCRIASCALGTARESIRHGCDRYLTGTRSCNDANFSPARFSVLAGASLLQRTMARRRRTRSGR